MAKRLSPNSPLGLSALRGFIAGVALIVHSCAATAQPEAPPVAIETARSEEVVENVILSATVTSPRVAQVSTSVAGLVREIHVDSGVRVKRGELLVQFDTALEELALERSKAAVREAREQLAEAERRLRIGLDLMDRATIPQNEVDARRAQVRIAEAALARLEAERKTQVERIRRHAIRAPFDSVVSQKMTELGEWVDPGAAVVELVAMDGLRIDVPVPQRYYPLVKRDSAVSVAFDALPDREFDGRVGALVPVSDPTARTFTLRVLLDDAGIEVTPGMSARVTLRLKTGGESVVVSRDAIIRSPDGRTVVWVTGQVEAGVAAVSERRIETGHAFDGRIEVVGGLRAGERVVVRGNESLREAQKVRIQNGS